MFLCIDTVTAESGIALVSQGGCLGFEPLESRHSSDGLFTSIDRLFNSIGKQPKDLHGVAVIRGPGSFTSVRVGVAVANPFAHQLKIPIVGLTTDQWHRFKTDEPDFLYLQTMNTDEVYAVGVGRASDAVKPGVIPLTQLPKGRPILWLGTLSEGHLQSLPSDYRQIEKTYNVQTTWVRCCDSVFAKIKTPKAYVLAEPFYGKEPHITPSKRRVQIGKIQ
jgi:tRNA threonylcarbamoyl adenosine modification protein YeaZ